MKSCLEWNYFSSSLSGFPCRKSAFFMPGIIFFLSLSKSTHTFVLCPTHFPLSFFMPTPPSPPFPLALFLFASALRGLREGCTTWATPFWQPPLHTVWNGTTLLCISSLWVGRVWRPVLEELLVPLERFGCMSREEAQCAAVVYLYHLNC